MQRAKNTEKIVISSFALNYSKYIGIETDQLLFLCSYDIIRSLEQNGWLLKKSAILFWQFH